MKEEQKNLWGFVGRCAVLIAFSSLYSLSGSCDFWGGQLWIRRWLAPALLCIWGAIVARDWRPLVCFPFMGASLTLPYGADNFWIKILLRTLFGTATGATFNTYNIWCKNYPMALLGIFITFWGSVILGVWNPTANPIQEQGLIGLLIATSFVFGIKRIK